MEVDVRNILKLKTLHENKNQIKTIILKKVGHHGNTTEKDKYEIAFLKF